MGIFGFFLTKTEMSIYYIGFLLTMSETSDRGLWIVPYNVKNAN